MFRRAYPNPARIDREDEKRMLPCRYFLAGFCHKGPRCKFFHPNMHVRDPFIRVPDLPSNFSMIHQNNRSRNDNGYEMRGSRSRSRRGEEGFRSPVASNSATSLSPKSRSLAASENLGANNLMSPSSHAYSEYQLSGHEVQVEDDYEDEEHSDGRASMSPERKAAAQNTIFNHIDWSEFLRPGVAPPVPTPVPQQGPQFF